MTTARRECLAQIRRQRTERPLATSDTDQPFPNPHLEAVVITYATRRQVRRATGAFERRPSCQNSCRRPIHEEQ
jgi:hypothetical protein